MGAQKNSEFVDVISQETVQNVENLIKLLNTVAIKVNDVNRAAKVIKLPSQGAEVIREAEQLSKSYSVVDQTIQKVNKSFADMSEKRQRQIERERLAELKLQKQREAAFDKFEKQEASKAALLSKSENEYNKIQVKVSQLTQTYNNLAAKQELGQQLTVSEIAQIKNLENELNKYQNILKNIDGRIGKYTRNVGNYASGWNGLSNSINQITREAPAFAVSLNTGFLALSNNIPVLADEIGRLRDQNKALQAEGKPTVSVLKQIGSSLFSFQTLISLGVTLLTIYGGKLIDMASSALKANNNVNDLFRSTTNLYDLQQNYMQKTADLASSEITTLDNLIMKVKDVNSNQKDRSEALRQLQERYPRYLSNIDQEAILTGKAAKAIDSLREALFKRAQALAIQELLAENTKEQIKNDIKYSSGLKGLNKEADLYNMNTQNLNKSKGKLRAITDAEAESLDYLTSASKKANETADKYNTTLLSADEIRKQALLPLKEEEAYLRRILEPYLKYIDVVETGSKSTKDYELTLQDLADVESSRYAFRKTALENEAELQKRVMDAEDQSYQDREAAAKRYHSIKIELAQNEYNENQRLLKQQLQDDLNSVKEKYESEVKKAKDNIDNAKTLNTTLYQLERNKNQVIKSYQDKFEQDSLKSYEDYKNNLQGIIREINNDLKGVWDKINFQKAENIITQAELDNTNYYISQLEDIVKNKKDYKKVLEAEKELNSALEKSQLNRLEKDKEAIQLEMDKFSEQDKNSTKYLELQKQMLDKDKEIAAVTKKNLEEQAAAIAKLQKATNSYLESFSNSVLDDFGFSSLNTFLKIEENGKTMFQNLMDGADTAGKKFAVAFNSIAEVAQQSVAFIQQNQQARFDAEYASLEKSKEINIKFAGDSEEAKAEIERQYDEQRRQIRIREAKAQKETAIFNAIINTAQGVTSALATANIPLSIIIGALGAAQVAMIAAREIPAYEDGTDNHPGGLMRINDAPGAVYREMVKEPGKAPYIPMGRNILVDAPKGTKVFPAGSFESELNGILSENGIAEFNKHLYGAALGNLQHTTVINNNGITEEEVYNAVSRAMGGLSTASINLDADGFSASLNKGRSTTTIKNRKLNFNRIMLR